MYQLLIEESEVKSLKNVHVSFRLVYKINTPLLVLTKALYRLKELKNTKMFQENISQYGGNHFLSTSTSAQHSIVASI